MIITETNYADYLFLLTPNESAASFDRVLQNQGLVPQETEYSAYRQGLSAVEKSESEYSIFLEMYDNTDIMEHPMYVDTFLAIGYDLDSSCKRKKGTPH
jgi:hypothetical protein